MDRLDIVPFVEGRGMSMSGFAKSASSWFAWAETGVRARRLRGRLERGSADVGTDSGMGSDMMSVGFRRMRERPEVVKLERCRSESWLLIR